VTNPEPVSGSPLKPWQWAELWALVLVVAVQLWLYTVSVLAAAACGLLVPALLVHMYFWMTPLLRNRPSHVDDRQD
jgi:membrane protein YdbS with pleckstrin-like domain